MSLTEGHEYVLDIKNTLISNVVNIILTPAAAVYIIMINNMIKSFTLPEMRVIGLFIFAYSTVKIIHTLCNVNFEYKSRNEEKVI